MVSPTEDGALLAMERALRHADVSAGEMDHLRQAASSSVVRRFGEEVDVAGRRAGWRLHADAMVSC